MELTNESKTLFIPLYGKALMSREGFFEDKTAEKIVFSSELDFDNTDKSRKLAIYMAMRADYYDRIAERFLRKFPDGTVIGLGCGLDSRCKRVRMPCKKWYDLDFPEVISIRKEYFGESDSYHMLSGSVTDFSWLDEISASSRVLVIAEGLSMYLSEEDMIMLFEKIREKFGQAWIMFDAYSKFAAKMSKYRNPINAVDAKIDFAMDDAELFEKPPVNAECVIDCGIIRNEQLERLKLSDRLRFSAMKDIAARLYRIYGYKIG